MKKQSTILLIAVLLIAQRGQAQKSELISKYIFAYKDLAIAEMKRTGVPASITLAQGIHESGAGAGKLVLASNNHFGIKCKSNWTGESVRHNDDEKGECFRKYPQAADSYKDHSDFLKNGQRYAFLFLLDPTDYSGWANGLKQAGYATNPKYPQVLIKLIEDYGLQHYTFIALGKIPDQAAELGNVSINQQADPTNNASNDPALNVPAKKSPVYPEGQFKINDTKVVFVKKGSSFLSIAKKYDVDLSKIFEFNETKRAESAEQDQLVYLQRKRKTGINDVHIVQPGETLHSIAQEHGIRLESLRELNWLKENDTPAIGEKLNLRSKSNSIPKLTVKDNYSLQPATGKKGKN
jgi:LysM repeat protein